MNPGKSFSACACCRLNRRQFLATGYAGCAAAVGSMVAPGLCAATQTAKMRIRIIYALHEPKQNRPDWPNQGFDFAPVMDKTAAELRKNCPDFQFTSSMANGEEQAKKIVEEDKTGGVDGYIVYQLNCWNRVVQTMAATGKPVLYVDFQYGGSGGFLTYTAAFLRSNAPNVGFVASSRMQDLVDAARCFSIVRKGGSATDFADATRRLRVAGTPKSGDLTCKADPVSIVPPDECVRRMKASRILAVRSQEAGPAAPIMEIPVENVSFAEINDAWKAADKDESRATAERWAKTAAVVEGVSRETLEQSAAMFLGMKAVMKKHSANAITVNCLGGFYGGHIHAYPCLGFHELNNQGLVGGCECDVRSAAAMVALSALTDGRPGSISDPVIDTSKRQIIYAHCVASNRVFGARGPANPFQILTHSEDRQGASVRSIMPVGYMTTTIEIHPDRRQILFHQGKSVANDPDDRACRTKLAVEPIGDIEKLLTQWDQWGWHRVTCYGDLKQPVYSLADALGWKVIEEA